MIESHNPNNDLPSDNDLVAQLRERGENNRTDLSPEGKKFLNQVREIKTENNCMKFLDSLIKYYTELIHDLEKTPNNKEQIKNAREELRHIVNRLREAGTGQQWSSIIARYEREISQLAYPSNLRTHKPLASK